MTILKFGPKSQLKRTNYMFMFFEVDKSLRKMGEYKF
jgi:hypothetical protein